MGSERVGRGDEREYVQVKNMLVSFNPLNWPTLVGSIAIITCGRIAGGKNPRQQLGVRSILG